LFRALHQYLDVPCELVMYPGEGHSPMKYTHRKAKMEWDLAWYEKYLGKGWNSGGADEESLLVAGGQGVAGQLTSCIGVGEDRVVDVLRLHEVGAGHNRARPRRQLGQQLDARAVAAVEHNEIDGLAPFAHDGPKRRAGIFERIAGRLWGAGQWPR